MCNSHYTKNWQKLNPEKNRINRRRHEHSRTERRRKLEVRHTWREWEELLDKFEGICAYCKTAKADTRDHVVPISNGGTDDIENILPACRSCNSRKSNMPLEKFIKKVLVIEDYEGEYVFNQIPIRNGTAYYKGKEYKAE